MARTPVIRYSIACLLRLLLDLLLFGGISLAQSIAPETPSSKVILPLPSYATMDDFQMLREGYFDLFRDHNQTLDTYRELVSRGLLSNGTPRVLVHIDYHSDLYRNNNHLASGFEGIGNYINALVSDGDINEIWWILPDATETPQQAKFFWGALRSYSDWQFRDGPADQLICVNQQGYLSFGPENMTCPGRKVPFHKRTLRMLEGIAKGKAYEQLVPAGALVGREALLDIDADFFDYNGLYANQGSGSTPRLYHLTYSPEKLNHEFARVLKALNRVGLTPVLTTCAMSMEYTNANSPQIEAFFRYLGIYSRTGTDYMVRYTHSVRTKDSYRGRKNLVRGIDAQIYYNLITADRLLGRHDRIDFHDTKRTDLARNLVMNTLKWSATMVDEKLRKIAQSQNHSHYIDLSALSQFDELSP